MSKGILGRKVGMTQIYVEGSGEAVPVTVVQAGPCQVLQIRSQERDGYEAVQLGFDDKKRPAEGRPRSRSSQATRAERGHVADIKSKRSLRLKAAGVELPAKAGCEPKKFVRELRGPADGLEVGQEVGVGILEGVKAVDVVGTNKGRGYAGVMKRHNFSGQRATHGVKKCHRYPGSTGQNTSPARVIKGRRMAGRYGGKQITTRNLRVVRVDADNNLLLVRGAIPGPVGGYVVVRETNMV
jgi:large subunit ribosomal protein L3